MITVVIVFSIFLLGVYQYNIYVQNQKLLSTVTKRNRGTSSEHKMVLKLLKSGFSPLAIFHDLYLINRSGSYSQIDIVLATKVGIIVFEVKEYSGWIFGTGYEKNWTQLLAYGKSKHRFYNPILQNKKHILDLRNQLPQFENIPFFSVIVFFGNCEFRKLRSIPDDTFICKENTVIEIVRKIIFNNKPAKYSDKKDVIRILSTAVKNGENSKIQAQHIKNINDMLPKRNFN